jgi:hypothetical protein
VFGFVGYIQCKSVTSIIGIPAKESHCFVLVLTAEFELGFVVKSLEEIVSAVI